MIKFCPMCGAVKLNNAKFCVICGLSMIKYEEKLKKLSLESSKESKEISQSEPIQPKSQLQPQAQTTSQAKAQPQPQPQSQTKPTTSPQPKIDSQKLFKQGIDAENKKDYKNAFNCYAAAMKAGNKKAITAIGKLFENGYGFPKDEVKSLQFYQKAASLNEAEACFILGEKYYTGKGVENDFYDAFDYISKGMEIEPNLISAEQLFILAEMYENGKGTSFNKEKAADLYKKSAEKGSANAMMVIGNFYYRGEKRFAKDLQTAKKYFENAVEKTEDRSIAVKAKSLIERIENELKTKETPPPPEQNKSKSSAQKIDSAPSSNTTQNILPAVLQESAPKFGNTEDEFSALLDVLVRRFSMTCVYYVGQNKKSNDKIKSAVQSYGDNIKQNEIVIGCFDNTFWGGAADGCIFTNKGIHIHNLNEDNIMVADYSQIKNVTLKGLIMKDVYLDSIKIDVSMLNDNETKNIFCQLIMTLREVFIEGVQI